MLIENWFNLVCTVHLYIGPSNWIMSSRENVTTEHKMVPKFFANLWSATNIWRHFWRVIYLAIQSTDGKGRGHYFQCIYEAYNQIQFHQSMEEAIVPLGSNISARVNMYFCWGRYVPAGVKLYWLSMIYSQPLKHYRVRLIWDNKALVLMFEHKNCVRTN